MTHDESDCLLLQNNLYYNGHDAVTSAEIAITVHYFKLFYDRYNSKSIQGMWILASALVTLVPLPLFHLFQPSTAVTQTPDHTTGRVTTESAHFSSEHAENVCGGCDSDQSV